MIRGRALARITVASAVLALAFSASVVVSPWAAAAVITQTSPTTESTNVDNSDAFSDSIVVGGTSDAVSFTTMTTTGGIVVSSSGQVSTTGMLAVGNYTANGTDTDVDNDMGTWTYTLDVTASTITQTSATTASTTVDNSSAYTGSVAVSGANGAPTFDTTSTPNGVTVDPNTGAISVAGPLAVGSYTVSGTDTDPDLDTGTWTFTLGVTASTITQTSATSASTSVNNSGAFSGLLSVTGANGTPSFTTTSTPNGVVVSSSGAISVTSSLPVGSYTVSGTDTDADLDTGTWTFTLNVVASGGSGTTTTITQTSSTTGTVLNTASGTFTAGPITVAGNTGSVTFVTTKSSLALEVSAVGLISTTGPLAIGTYVVSGTDSDVHGDTGTWTYTLTVTGVVVSVTFNANGGKGVMAPESESEPTPLSLNGFTWVGHTFVDWNTAANGTGVKYANGAVFPFTAPTPLFAQWKAGIAPTRTIMFAANGGSGTTPSEHHNTPTAISPDGFVRKGYTFVDWNTKATGAGVSYKAGEVYAFKKSISLYAQWKKVVAPIKPSYSVTFFANGGAGKMAVERHQKPASLLISKFTRSGYTFRGWNTAANGSGTSFSNGATYSFTSSTSLYAQWKKNKVVVPPPPVAAGPQIGPFAPKSSTLSSALESQIRTLADQIKSGHDTQITLLGYGDQLTSAESANPTDQAANITLSRERAESVATYLEGKLADLGLKGWAISIATAPTGGSASSQGADGIVVAELS
jgi:uncharacterized repeat protein (TIGR02543 family)